MHCALIRMKTVAAFLLLVNIKVYKFHKFLHFTTVDFLDQTHIVTVQRLGKIGNNSHVDGLFEFVLSCDYVNIHSRHSC